MVELVPGGNLSLPEGALTLRVPGPFDLSALVTGDDGKVGGDADFVFYNQPAAPGVRLVDGGLGVDPARLRAGASRVTLVVSPADPGTSLSGLPVPTLSVSGGDGRTVARFAPPRPGRETVLLLAELYRRGPAWKLRALGQGYADGLAGIARDFGVDVLDEEPAPTPQPVVAVPSPAAGASDGIAGLVNARRARCGAPPVTVDPRLTAAARRHAAAMAEQGRLAAEGPDGVSVFQRVTAGGYAYLGVAEQLVSGPRTPDEFLDYCLGSEEARRPLRDASLTAMGLGHAVDGRSGTTYWTAVWAAPFSPGGLAGIAAEVVALTNAERAAAGLRPLADDRRLAAAAQAHSADMVARDFYAHTSPEGRQPWDRAAAAGCAHRGIGENIACGQRSAAEVVDGWMNSPGHRANILKPDFTHIGIGFVGGGRVGTYWTQLFGMAS
ncbi:CAP domain-containing protein [Streptomyces sp. UNOC14_S4]|uniref:CAP domain-containing protein n=1 Tax=Streptomyces sp. UNOC14_S4 TaxID=2872340 RepID=UPI001E5C4F48|nr:CAP domain-containing protein [Streptomyces sp. UNOC14_S4]MCC3770016.1 TerD family protein [Streptomyces sp. UNOC14_S4]